MATFKDLQDLRAAARVDWEEGAVSEDAHRQFEKLLAAVEAALRAELGREQQAQDELGFRSDPIFKDALAFAKANLSPHAVSRG